MIRTSAPQQATIYRRLTEFRALYVRLLEKFPNSGLPELPVLKEGVFTVYDSLLEQLFTFFESLLAMGDEIVYSDVVQDFLLESPTDKAFQTTAFQVVSSGSMGEAEKAATL